MLKLYIWIMPFIDPVRNPLERVPTSYTGRSSDSGVNAHLRMFPRDRSTFRVVLKFHLADGSLCEAELSPDQAADLVNEIAGVIEQGRGAVFCEVTCGASERVSPNGERGEAGNPSLVADFHAERDLVSAAEASFNVVQPPKHSARRGKVP